MKKNSVLMISIMVVALVFGISGQAECGWKVRHFDFPPVMVKAFASEEPESNLPSQAPESGVYDPAAYLNEEIVERVGRINEEFARSFKNHR